MISLTGTVAVVTGASRGIGKGIAAALGDSGATVYVTGRTATVGEHELPGTIGETAAEVTRRGGTGIAVQMDHADDGQVTALFDRIRVEQGRLDILVNNAFTLPDDLTDPKPFWEKPLSNWEMVDVGVRSNFAAARLAAQIMVPQGIRADRRHVGLRRRHLHLRSRLRTVQDRRRPDGPRHGHRATTPQRRVGITVAGTDDDRTGTTQSECSPRDDEIDRHPSRCGLLSGVPRPGHRGTGHRPRSDEPLRGHLHHRRTRTTLRNHRHRRQNHPVAARRTGIPYLATNHGSRPWMLTNLPGSNAC